MSIKKFLQDRGFVEKDNDTASKTGGQEKQQPAPQSVPQNIAPTYFPVHDSGSATVSAAPPNAEPPAYEVTRPAGEKIDDAFIKFFEDELEKNNFPGPDYFEFRRQMAAMNQKIGKRGTPPEVILQAVLTSFEAQNVPAARLIETAKQYRDLLQQKKTDFLKGAAAEKDKQLQKRQSALQTHQTNLSQMQNQLQQLQAQMNQLQDMIKREQTQTEVDKTLGKEGIEKIERAEKQISLAHDYMTTVINTDITQLQSA